MTYHQYQLEQVRKKTIRKIDKENIDRREDEVIDLSQTFPNPDVGLNYTPDSLTTGNSDGVFEPTTGIHLSRRLLITEQGRDSQLTPLFNYVLPEYGLEKVPTGYFIKNKVLMRKWRSPHIPASED